MGEEYTKKNLLGIYLWHWCLTKMILERKLKCLILRLWSAQMVFKVLSHLGCSTNPGKLLCLCVQRDPNTARQKKGSFRKPIIVLSPLTSLRLPVLLEPHTLIHCVFNIPSTKVSSVPPHFSSIRKDSFLLQHTYRNLKLDGCKWAAWFPEKSVGGKGFCPWMKMTAIHRALTSWTAVSCLHIASISSITARSSHIPEAEEQEMSGQFSKWVPEGQTVIHWMITPSYTRNVKKKKKCNK